MANNNKTKNRAAYASNLKPSMLALAVSSCLAFPVLAQDTANTDDEAVKLERIEVTARRTVENLQTVPVAVTSLGEEQLAQRGIDNITSVQQYSLVMFTAVINSHAILAQPPLVCKQTLPIAPALVISRHAPVLNISTAVI